MEHIRQFDWCASRPDIYFVNEPDMESCVTERILRNKFRDPMISSDSEDEVRPRIDWSKVFKQKNTNDDRNQHLVYAAGLRPVPQYPKQSSLTSQQHYQLLKVLCARQPKVLDAEFVPRPTPQDYKAFEDLKEAYLKEQKEYIDWAKTMWTTTQCGRALRPKPGIEMVYEAEFKMKATEMESWPKQYELAAQIPLESMDKQFDMVLQKDLIGVNVWDLPKIECPDLRRKFSILRLGSVPEPCNKHPCKFVLPTEDTMSVLPLGEVHRELAQYALDSGVQYIASEKALKCLLELDRPWTLPLSVCQVIGADGEKTNVLVIGSEFSVNSEAAQTRTYKAFRHLLEFSFIPSTEKAKMLSSSRRSVKKQTKAVPTFAAPNKPQDPIEVASSDDEDHLIIDADINTPDNSETESVASRKKRNKHKTPTPIPKTPDQSTVRGKNETSPNSGEFYNCTCKDSLFECPPPRSYKKWMVRNNSSDDSYEFIVHCSHKVRGQSGEVLLEPTVEYQLDLGASKQSEHKTKSLALSLYLRQKASVLDVRVDSQTGDVVTLTTVHSEADPERHIDVMRDVSNTVWTALNQLHGLLPGKYLLQHEANHGTNALLYVARARGHGQKLLLNFDCSKLAEDDEAKIVKTPPTLIPALLPCHKFRKILPCAFTPFAHQVAREQKKPVARQKTPPQAIKWPKRKARKKKSNQQ